MPEPPRRAALVFIFVTALLDMLAVGVIIPVLPKLIIDFLGGDTAGTSAGHSLRAGVLQTHSIILK